MRINILTAAPSQPSPNDLPDHIRKELERRQGGGK